MHIVFRVDASLQIGSGHIMRCLTLADALSRRGATCSFICRPHKGHLLALIAERGHRASALAELPTGKKLNLKGAAHADWLGTDIVIDAQDTQQELNNLASGKLVDWLVIDHYALDKRWEIALKAKSKRIMVIDDLADRSHSCDLLLDQTFGRQAADYIPLVSDGCELLCGSQYALLRPEFAALRQYSLTRRSRPALKELLITMGGVDKDNITGAVLRRLKQSSLPEACRITVVAGQTSPWLTDIQNLAAEMPWPTRVLVGVTDMAQLMSDSDFAIGAAGATSWERCCLGLPSIMLVVADNQLQVAKGLEEVGAAMLCKSVSRLPKQLELLLGKHCVETRKLTSISRAAIKVTDGLGVNFVVEMMEAQI
jgi:UDP-2,4-diacetamido-2,4,6-trideoxy-beta-L-altropyranose hydrolase